MRAIINKQSIVVLAKANEKPPQTSEEARKRWKKFSDHKGAVTSHMLIEQLGLCAYTELAPNQENLDTHIEHIKPKRGYPELTFDYRNLVISALSSHDLQQLPAQMYFGGHAKEDDYDEALFVSCLEENCQQFFAYLSNGTVVASENLTSEQKERAEYTIGLLNLNSPYLQTRRKNWIEEVEQLIEQHIDKDMSLEALAAIYLQPSNNQLYPFYSATCRLFGKLTNVAQAKN